MKSYLLSLIVLSLAENVLASPGTLSSNQDQQNQTLRQQNQRNQSNSRSLRNIAVSALLSRSEVHDPASRQERLNSEDEAFMNRWRQYWQSYNG